MVGNGKKLPGDAKGVTFVLGGRCRCQPAMLLIDYNSAPRPAAPLQAMNRLADQPCLRAFAAAARLAGLQIEETTPAQRRFRAAKPGAASRHVAQRC